MAHLTLSALTDRTFPEVQRLSGGAPTAMTTLVGGASIRRYHRVQIAGGKWPTLVIMELGDDPLKSEEATSHRPAAELPFINIQRFLAEGGVAVPEILSFDPALGLVYLEDLGDITFESRVVGANTEVQRRYYQLAIAELVRIQGYAAARPDPGCLAFQRSFDFALLKWELDHFREYGLEAQGIVLDPPERTELERQFQSIAERLAAAPRGFVHRDYQSRNLMVQDQPNGPRLRVIDFQDALLGTAVYDLVGLLRDSYVALPSPLLEELVRDFAARSGRDPMELGALFDLQTVQRKLKDAGRFVFIDRVKKNPSFLPHIPNSLAYVGRALSRLPELASLQEILDRRLQMTLS